MTAPRGSGLRSLRSHCATSRTALPSPIYNGGSAKREGNVCERPHRSPRCPGRKEEHRLSSHTGGGTAKTEPPNEEARNLDFCSCTPCRGAARPLFCRQSLQE